MSYASVASGADGLIVEVHNDPENALCDGDQSILPSEFEFISNKIKKMAGLFNKIY
jgi:3-deoxy-7-phosphoheptulonate synthase